MRIAQFCEGSRVRLGLIQADALIPVDFDGDMIQFIESHRESRGALKLQNSQTIDLDRVGRLLNACRNR